MDELKLIPKEGWSLNLQNPPNNCNFCEKPINLPFFWCESKKIGLCLDCNKKQTPCKALHYNELHEHFNIIQVKKL